MSASANDRTEDLRVVEALREYEAELRAGRRPDRAAFLARYPGGDANVLSGLMRGADEIAGRPFAIDVPGGYSGKGRVVLFSNNPIYRWQNHAEFNLVFNTMLNWNDLGAASAAPPRAVTSPGGGR